MRYKLAEDGVVVSAGTGETLNMGSGGVAFTTEGTLEKGAFLELSISWPVLLGDSCPMRLVVFGRVLRSNGKKAVCTVDKYEFRTQSRKVHTVPQVVPDPRLSRWADGMRKGELKTSSARA